MLNKRRPDLNELIWGAADRVGRSAPLIADAILASAFPRTLAEATLEGADKLLRDGLIATIKRVLNTSATLEADEAQVDFSEVDPTFAAIVKRLNRPSYYVEARGEYVPVAELIANPAQLDDARLFMRRKGDECIAQADVLDLLYAAVTA